MLICKKTASAVIISGIIRLNRLVKLFYSENIAVNWSVSANVSADPPTRRTGINELISDQNVVQDAKTKLTNLIAFLRVLQLSIQHKNHGFSLSNECAIADRVIPTICALKINCIQGLRCSDSGILLEEIILNFTSHFILSDFKVSWP